MGAGMIVRMIDIVMILLFGFICTAQLSSQSRITLPMTVELPPATPDPEIVVYVAVTGDGKFWWDDEKQFTSDPAVLEGYLAAKKGELVRSQYKMRVRIRANHDTPVRYVMQAATICDRLEILKTVDVRIGSKYKQ